MVTTDSSLKERVEQTLVNLFEADETLALLVPTKQNEDAKNKRPRMSVVATPGKEISPGLGVYRVPTAIEFEFNAKSAGQTPEDMDAVVKAAQSVLRTRQQAGTFGLIFDGEPTSFEDETVRKRTINVTILAA